MNERIKELEKQATTVVEGWSDENGTTRYYEFNREKFAELIVRECLGCCEQVISDPVPKSVDTWLNGGEQCIQEIKEHFGLGMSVEDKKQLIKDLLGVSNDTKS
jgi:hypothetical protein